MSYCHRVDKPQSIHLADFDPANESGLDKEVGEELADKLGKELDELEDLLFYAGTHSLLVVLQGMDTSGKDGTIRFLFKHMNGQSVRVAPFKVPTPEELAHDFLWRVHMQAPGKGSVCVFNRSHYEDVLVVRVHNLVAQDVWSKRYEDINAFEKILSDANTIVIKFFLHISKAEQEKRLLEREAEVEKAWKLSVGDWRERTYWEEYIDAYQEAIGRCSTAAAPWFVVPSNHKWHRNLAIVDEMVKALRPFKSQWLEHLQKVGDKAKAELAEFRAQQK